MALSNIFREPQREITESVVGLAVFSAAAWADYLFAHWFYEITGAEHGGCPWPIGMLFGVAAVFGIIFVVVMTHALGDAICNALQRRGIHLRPRERA